MKSFNSSQPQAAPVILGLDISTAAVGVAVIDGQNTIKNLAAIDLRSIEDIWAKADEVTKHLTGLFQAFTAENLYCAGVYIEAPMSRYAPGRTSSATLGTVARFNGIVSSLARIIFRCLPVYVNVSAARGALGIRTRSLKGISPKDAGLAWARAQAPTAHWPTHMKRDGSTVPDDTAYDIADALVIVAYAAATIREAANRARENSPSQTSHQR